MVQMEGLVWLVGLKLRLVSWLALTKYRCEFDNLNCISAITPILKSRPVSIGWVDMEMTPLAPFSFTNSGNVITARKQQANIEDDS